MAVTSMWPIKGRVDNVIRYACNPEKTSEQSSAILAALHAVKDAVQYAADDMKTEKRMYVTCLNCVEEGAVESFKQTYESWESSGDRVCYHGLQSFAEGEVDAETAHKIGVELAERLWGDRFQVVVATHCNTNHYHNHFVLCAVSFVDGKRFDNNGKDYRRMREESDRLCREYGLSTITHPNGQRKNYAEWQAEKNGQPTIRGNIREAIDTAVRGSAYMQQFYRAMDQMGYIIDTSGKYPKIKQVGSQRFIRFKSLGTGYNLEVIKQRIYDNEDIIAPYIPPQENPRQIFDDEDEPVALMDFATLYRCYLRALTIVQERPATNRRLNFLLRDDVGYARRVSDQLELVYDHKLKNADDVAAYRKQACGEIDRLKGERQQLYNALKRAQRADDSLTCGSIRCDIDVYNRQLRQLRTEVKACDGILENADAVREKLMRIEQNKFKGKEDIIQYEHIRRSGGSDRQAVSGRSGDGDTIVR